MQGYKKCNHFVWLDEEMNSRAEEVISSLLQNLNDEKQKMKDAIRKDEDEIIEEAFETQLDNYHCCINCICCFNNNEIGY